MKKILSLLIVTFFIAKTASAQSSEEMRSKNMRFGIKFAPSVSWMAPDNANKIQKDGLAMKMALGLVTEFRITDVAVFATGIDYMTGGGKTKYLGSDTAGYFYKDDAIVAVKTSGGNITDPDPTNASTAPTPANSYKAYQLQKRNYKIGYVHIPLTLKLRTKDISGMTYFGQLGGDIFIRTSAKSNDVALDGYNNNASVTLNKLDVSKQVSLMNLGVNFGGGVEYNLSGSTSVFGSLHYVHSLFNTTKSDSDYLIRSKETNGSAAGTKAFAYDRMPNALKNHQIVLAIGILF